MRALCTEPTSEEGRDKRVWTRMALRRKVHELKIGCFIIQKEEKEEKEEE